jgi:DNA polymerase III epsilon subunit-like protein
MPGLQPMSSAADLRGVRPNCESGEDQEMKTVVFDFETGGLESQPSIQLAAIVVVDATGKEVAQFEQKIRFDVAACDPKALEINRYSAEAWKDAISPSAAADRFATFVKPHCCIEAFSKRTGRPFSVAKLAGYNAVTFDWPRLKALFADRFLPCSYHVRDVMQRAMFWFDEHGKKPKDLKLTTVCEYFGIETENAHDALADVRMTAQLAERLRLP